MQSGHSSVPPASRICCSREPVFHFQGRADCWFRAGQVWLWEMMYGIQVCCVVSKLSLDHWTMSCFKYSQRALCGFYSSDFAEGVRPELAGNGPTMCQGMTLQVSRNVCT